MSTYILWGENMITVPKFNFMVKTSSNSYMFEDKYMRFFAVFCFFGGLKMFWGLMKKLGNGFRSLMCNIMPKKISGVKYAIIIGFADVKEVSTTVLDNLIKMGYKVICVYSIYDKESSTKASSLVSEENKKNNVELIKDEDFCKEKSVKVSSIEFIIDIGNEIIPFVDKSSTQINMEKCFSKLTLYQRIFEQCNANGYLSNGVKLYNFYFKSSLISPTNIYLNNIKLDYLSGLASQLKSKVILKKVEINDIRNFNDSSMQYLYKYSDLSSYDSFSF